MATTTTRSGNVEHTNEKQVLLLQQQVTTLQERLSKSEHALDKRIESSADYLKELIDKVDHRSLSHGQDLARQEGRSGLAALALPIALGLGAMLFSGVLWTQVTSNTTMNNSQEVALERKNQRIADFEDWQDGHQNLDTDLQEIKTTLKTINLDLRADEGKFNQNAGDIVALKATTGKLNENVVEHEEELDALESEFARLGRDLAGTKARHGAAVVEIETQLRAINEISNVRHQELQSTDALLWQKQRGEPYPDKDYYPTDIPAKATTTIGGINGGG